MGIRNKAYRILGLLVAITLAGTIGCAVKPTAEMPTPSTTAEETFTSTPTPIPTPVPSPVTTPTPVPTPDLTFRTADDLDNEEILRNQAKLISDKFKNSNVPCSVQFTLMDESEIENYLLWLNGKKPNEVVSSEAAQFVFDCFINAIRNEEVMIMWDIYEGKRKPIKNANFVGYADIMPTTSSMYSLATKINKIKNELASFPSKERQLELAQESLNLSLDFMLSNDAVYNDQNAKEYYMVEDDGRNIETIIEPSVYKMNIGFELTILANIPYIIDPTLKSQYPTWHKKYPDYLEISNYDKKYIDFLNFIYPYTLNKMVDECLADK